MSRRDGAIVAWHEVGQRHPKEPSRRVRSDSRRCAHRFDDWSNEISNTKIETETRRTCRREIPLRFAAPDHPVPYGTVLRRDAFPSTSCQATIGVVPTGRAGKHFATASSYDQEVAQAATVAADACFRIM